MSMICHNCGAAVGREDWEQNEGLCDVCAEKEAKKNTLPFKVISWFKRISLYNAIKWTLLFPLVLIAWIIITFVGVPLITMFEFFACDSWEEFKSMWCSTAKDFVTLRVFTDPW